MDGYVGVKTQIEAAGFFIAGLTINRRATHEYEQAAGIFALRPTGLKNCSVLKPPPRPRCFLH